MKHFINIAIHFFLFCVQLARADTATHEQEKRTDGKVRIGGILHSEKDLEDPKYRTYAEKLAKDVEKMREKAKEPVDLSNKPMLEIISLSNSLVDEKYLIAARMEFLKRPEETKNAIREIVNSKIDGEHLPIMLLSTIPVAKNFGSDYHNQIVKKVLFHPLAGNYNDIFLTFGNLMDALAESPHDETATLDKLIEQGRVTKGSELEIKWRKMLTKKAGGSNERPAHTTAANGSQQGKYPAKDTAENESSESQRLPLPWKISGVLLAFCLGLFVWLRIKSSKV
jgi:hypothetical protein